MFNYPLRFSPMSSSEVYLVAFFHALNTEGVENYG